jgi:uncharacterized protein YjgD (DUF1641 family)
MSETNTQADVVRLVQAASEAMTDNMVERLSITSANALEVVDRLNDEDTRDAVMSVIDKMTDLHRSGALETLFDTVSTLHGARSALTDNMVERLFIFVEHMINNLANEEIAEMAHNARRAMEEAVDDTSAQGAPSGGLLSMVSMLSKPETQKALQFLLAFACKMEARSTAQHGIADHEDR